MKNRGNYKHGFAGTKIHRIWSSMIMRCNNPNDPGYKRYGGRGIGVCNEWENDFKAFYNYISKLPGFDNLGKSANNLSLDRKDNNGDYEPGNIRLATRHEQAVNRRNHMNNKTGYVGVSFRKDTGTYRSFIRINGKLIHLGGYILPEDAYMARVKYIIKHGLLCYLESV